MFFCTTLPLSGVHFFQIYGLFLWHDSECTVIAQPIIFEVSSEYLYSSFIIINHLIKKIIVQTVLSNESAENLSQVRQGQRDILNDITC